MFKPAVFKNPVNGHIQTITIDVWIFALLFGPLYFAYKGVWQHALISFILAILSGGISAFIYCWFAKSILRTHFLQKGFVEVSGNIK